MRGADEIEALCADIKRRMRDGLSIPVYARSSAEADLIRISLHHYHAMRIADVRSVDIRIMPSFGT